MKIYDYHGKRNLCGERVKDARLLNRMTQADLSAKMQIEGVTLERDGVSRIEAGARFVADYELLTFSRVLGVSVEQLLGL